MSGSITNAERARRFDRCFEAYQGKGSLDEIATDILTDLWHWCDRESIDTAKIFRRSAAHHKEETT